MTGAGDVAEVSAPSCVSRALPWPALPCSTRPALRCAQVMATLGYASIWIAMSGAVIMYNKFILSHLKFPFPLALTMVGRAPLPPASDASDGSK